MKKIFEFFNVNGNPNNKKLLCKKIHKNVRKHYPDLFPPEEEDEIDEPLELTKNIDEYELNTESGLPKILEKL